jgi:hypothetical protein
MKRSTGMLRRAHRSQARRAGDFDVADPKGWHEIFGAGSPLGSRTPCGRKSLHARRAVRRVPREESWRSKI